MSTFEAKTKAARTRKFMITSALTAASAVALSVSPAQADDPSPWSQWMTEHGEISISLSDLLTLITQHSDIYIGTSGTLNIPEGYTVRITGGSLFAAKAAMDADPTRILGSLISDGRVIILDRNGVFFGQNSHVDAAGLIASSGTIDNDQIINNDFGSYTIDNIGADADARIDLNGTINIADAGLAAFVAPTVSNSGVINARYGKVGFASGERVTIDPYGDQLFEIEVPSQVASLLENTETGEINAEGGVVTMSSQVAEGIVDNLINVDGVVNVSSVTQQGGKIVLSAGNGDVNVSGTLNASGVQGGDIDVRGENVTVADSASVNADGVDGGAAGHIDLIADDRLTVAGDVSARGQTGTGFIETSGYDLDFRDGASVLTTGLWLIDPANFTINNFWANQLQNQLAIGNALISTFTGGPGAGNIYVQAMINWATNFTLTLNAYGDIIFNHVNAGINATGGGNVVMNAGDDIRILDGFGINLNGGTATFDADDEFQVGSGQSVNVNGGIINVVADAFDLDGYLNAGDGAINISRDNDPGSFDDDTNIDIGDWNGSNFYIDQDELDRMTAGTLSIGSADGANNQIHVGNADFRAFNHTILNTRRDDFSATQDLFFSGENLFGALTVNADDDIVFADNAIVRTLGNTVFNTDTNVGGVGSFTMGENSLLTTNGYNLTVNTIYVNLLSGAVINASGGNIDFNNTGIFYSADADSVRTAFSGTVQINQWEGGSINNAVAAILNTGDGLNTVFVGPGTFNESVLIDQANLWLQGTGAGSTVIDPNSPGVHIIADNATVTGFTINTGDDGVLVDGADNASIFGNTFTNQTANGVRVTNGSNGATVNDNIFTLNNGVTGVLINGGDSHLVQANNFTGGYNAIRMIGATNSMIGGLAALDGNVINGTDGSSDSNGIFVEGGSSNSIQNNTVNNSGWDGIKVVDSDNTNIVGNVINNAYLAGITVLDSSNNLIEDNTVLDSGEGIHSDHNYGITINHNTIHGTETWYGILNRNGWDSTITNNDIDHTQWEGIYVWANGGVNTIANNTVNHSGNGVNAADGIAIWYYVSNANISGNTVLNSGRDGIHVAYSDGAVVSGNTVHHVADDGVQIVDSNDVDIFSNTIHHTGGHGVYVDPSEHVDVAYNTIHDVGSDGIHVDGGSYVGMGFNSIWNAADDGIDIDGSDYVWIWGNGIAYVGDNGIEVSDSYESYVAWNEIDDVVGNGIYVEDSDYAGVENNDIDDVGANGIYVSSSDYAGIRWNEITHVDRNGILVNPSDYVDIAHNDIHWALWDGIHVTDGVYADIWDNHIGNIGGEGVDVNNNDYVQVHGNEIHDVGGNGVEVSDSYDAHVVSNNIWDVGNNGIAVSDSYGAYVAWNEIDDVGNNGIYVEDSDWTDVENNDIDDAGANGIYVSSSDYAGIRWNEINHVDRHGILVNPSDYVDIAHNDIHWASSDGIHVDNGDYADIWDNHVGGTGDDGIDVNDNDHVEIHDNEIHDAGGNGIEVSDSYAAYIASNYIESVDENGIYLGDSNSSYIGWNVVEGVDENGIYVNSSDFVDVVHNNVDDVGEHGILVNWSDFVDIAYNHVNFVGWDGVHVNGGDYADIWSNSVGFVWGDGIDVQNNDWVEIWDNYAHDVGDSGIAVDDSFDAYVGFNNIWFTGGDGIEVSGSAYADIRNNEVWYAGDDGIDVDDSAHVDVNWNFIHSTDNNGIEVTNSFDADIIGNWVAFTGDDGIFADHIFGGDIRWNDVSFTGDDGIDVRNSDWLDVVDNDVQHTWGDGIQVRDSDHVEINDNFIRFAGDDGIDLENSYDSVIDGNDVADVHHNGIEVEDSSFVSITNNTVEDAGDAGIFVDPSYEIYVGNNTLTGNNIGIQFVDITDGVIENNTILNSLTTGIHIEGSDGIEILFNDITDSGQYGLHVAGGYNGSVVLVGNVFTNNPVGAFFESGLIDITDLDNPNRFVGGDVAMRFSPFELPEEEGEEDVPALKVGFAPLALVNDTLGGTIFEGQSTYYVELLNGALFDPGNPTIIDGRYASFDGIVPINDFPLDPFGNPIIPVDILNAIEAMLRDFDDAGTEGQIFVGNPLSLDNVEDFLKKFGAFSPAAARLNITILGLPRVGVTGAGGGVFNAITPFAGGEGEQTDEERVALIEPAAGGEEGGATATTAAEAAAIQPAAGGETNCLAQAVNAATGGAPTVYSYGGTFEDAGLQGISACGGLQSF